jgi:competence protein ComEC
LIILLIDKIIEQNTKYDGYNKYINQKLEENLSEVTAGLIITTVTGDQNYINFETKTIFKELGILHLIALSGSNIVIYLFFLRTFRKKASSSYILLFLVSLLLYFIYTNQLHPLARAILFMSLIELYNLAGVERLTFRHFLILAILSAYLLFWSDFSMSMILSLIFSLSIYLYEYLRQYMFPDVGRLVNHLIFSIYMFGVSVPVYIFIFESDPSITLLLSNLIISPIFELSLYIFYFLYLFFIIFDFQLPYLFVQFIELPVTYIYLIYDVINLG